MADFDKNTLATCAMVSWHENFNDFAVVVDGDPWIHKVSLLLSYNLVGSW